MLWLIVVFKMFFHYLYKQPNSNDLMIDCSLWKDIDGAKWKFLFSYFKNGEVEAPDLRVACILDSWGKAASETEIR